MSEQIGNDVTLSFGGTVMPNLTSLGIELSSEILDASNMTVADWETLITGRKSASLSFEGVLYIGSTAVNGYIMKALLGANEVAGSRSWEISVSREVIDVSSKASLFRKLKPGRGAWSFSMENVEDFTDTTGQKALRDAILAGTSLTLKLGADGDTDDLFFSGSGLTESFGENFPDNAEATNSVSLRGTGALTLTTAGTASALTNLVSALIDRDAAAAVVIANAGTPAVDDFDDYTLSGIVSEFTISGNDNEVVSISGTIEVTGTVTANYGTL